MSTDPAAELGARAARLAAERTVSPPERTAGVWGCYCPPEIPDALGLDPAVVSPGTDAAAARAAEQQVGPDSCSLCRSLVGGPLSGNGWTARLAVLAVAPACDQRRHAAEAFARLHGARVFSLALPRTCGDSAFLRYLEELTRVASALADLAGRPLDPAELAAAVARWRALRRRLRRLRPAMSFARFARLVADCFLLGAERSLGLLDATGELPAAPAPGPRLFLAGSCLGAEEAAALGSEAAALGTDFVDDFVPTVAGLLEPEVPEGFESLRGLAGAFFRVPHFGRRPNDAWVGMIAERARCAGADAVVLRCQRFCDCAWAERLRLAERLRPLPVLALDEEGGADAAGRRRTRLEALLEEVACRGA